MTARLVTREAHPWPSHCAWLNTTSRREAHMRLPEFVLHRAFQDIGMCEEPLGSNRGPQIDEYLRRAKVPERIITSGKGYWCAAAVGAWFIDAGAKVPKDYASCDAWLPFLDPDNIPRIGSAIVFGKHPDAVHIEIVARLSPLKLTIGGNKSFANGSSNNGVAVDLHELTRKDVIGYVHPVPVG